jgi:hypothetical protein
MSLPSLTKKKNNNSINNEQVILRNETQKQLHKKTFSPPIIFSSIINNSNYNSNKDSFISKIFQETNPLAIYYSKDEGNKFISKLNKLNLNFLSISDKYQSKQKDIDKLKDNLFFNLFKQINIYIEEIERLNIKLKAKTEKTSSLKSEKIIKDLKEQIIQNSKTIKLLETKLKDKKEKETKIKKDITLYKRQANFYKEKLKIEQSINNNLTTSNEKNVSITYNNIVHTENNVPYINVNTTIKKYIAKYDKKGVNNKNEENENVNVNQCNNKFRKISPNVNRLFQKIHKKNNLTPLNYNTNLSGRTNRSENGICLKKYKKKERDLSFDKQATDNNNPCFCSTFLLTENDEIDMNNINNSKKKDNMENNYKQKILNEIGDDIKEDYEKEIEMLIEQEKEISNLIKRLQ